VKLSVEEDGAYLISGPPASGKTLALRSLYAVFGALTNSPPHYALVSVFVEELKSRAKEKPCKKGVCVECSFEISLNDVNDAIKESWKALLNALSLPALKASVNGEDLTHDASALCRDYKVYTGPHSFLELSCDGATIKGGWHWCPEDEIPYPYDFMASEVFVASDGLAVYLPPGRGYLGTKEECGALLETQTCKGLKGSELEVEEKLLEWALSEGDYVFIEGIYLDEEYLQMLKELLSRKKSKLVVIESREARVAETLDLKPLDYARSL